MSDQLGGLEAMGWHRSDSDAFPAFASNGFIPARVVAEERGRFMVHDGVTTFGASVSGRLRHESGGDALAYPAVGDWVATETDDARATGTIHALLPRRSVIVRRSPSGHRTATQIIAANVDIVFVVTSLNGELNLRRLERYLAVVWESGAIPVIVLSKSDLDEDVEGHRLAAASVAPGVEILVSSAVTGGGIDEIRAHLSPGRTVAFIGSSGVGKSTLVNRLAGHELMTVSGIREDDARGRHTTTRRQLVPLAEGLVIDTPGMRELALLDGDGIAAAFDDIGAVALTCRFTDCEHRSEPGCAVQAAIVAGELDGARFEAFEKLGREARRSELATDAIARKAERRKWSVISRSVDRHMNEKYGRER